jgi:hypothetical protein
LPPRWRRSSSFKALHELISFAVKTAFCWAQTTRIECSSMWNQDPHTGTFSIKLELQHEVNPFGFGFSLV